MAIVPTIVAFSEVNMKILSSLLIATLSAFLVSGCATNGFKGVISDPALYSQLVAENYHAADALITQARPKLVPDQPILIATIVNIDDLEKSSTLGRVTSEHIATRFFQAGVKVVEMKLSKSVYMKRNEGELVLTREITDIVRNHNVQAVVLGTYGKSKAYAYVNVKLVIPGSNIIIASHDYVIPLDDEIRTLIGK